MYSKCVCALCLLGFGCGSLIFTLAGCQNSPLPVVDQDWLTTAVDREHLRSLLTVCVCVCVIPCIFMLAYTEAGTNEDTHQLYK